jgi:hypothetical protein
MVAWNIANEATFQHPYPWPCLIPLALAALGGALLGLIVSTCANSEQAAVGAVPLLLLPQVLLSKVAVTGSGWFNSSVFASITQIGDILGRLEASLRGALDLAMFVASLPLFSRSGTAAMDLGGGALSGDAANLRASLAELLLLLILALLHGVAWVVVFNRREGKWSIR